MHRILTFCGLLMVIMVPLGCSLSGNDANSIGKVAQAWADSYFNFDYDKAETLVTADSHKWIAMAASNISEQDIAVIRSQEFAASASVQDVEWTEGSSQAWVSIEMKDVLVADTIGRPMHALPSAIYKICVVKSGNEWKVRMAGLPQNEMQNRD